MQGKILLADDERDILGNMEFIINVQRPENKKRGITTETSAESAIEKIQQEFFDLVITDYNFEGQKINGTHIAIKAIEYGIKNVIIYSAMPEHVLRNFMGEEYADKIIYLTKIKTDIKEIKRKVDEILGNIE